jgi:hypothetical protein
MKPLPLLIAALTPLLLLREAPGIDQSTAAPAGVQGASEVESVPEVPEAPTAAEAPLAAEANEEEAIVDLLEQRAAVEAVAGAQDVLEVSKTHDPDPILAEKRHVRRHGRRKPHRLPAGRSFAPIGVPLTQQVATGRVGVTLRASQDTFDGLRDGRNDRSSAEIFGRGFTIAPTQRYDQRFELEAVFGFDARWDIYFVLPYATRSMDMDLSLGGESDVDSSSLGDIQIGGIFRSYDRGPTRVSFMGGISLPTGEFDAEDDYAGVANSALPYSMHVGSGTFDLLPAALIESRWRNVLLGARASGRIHLQGAHDEGWFRSNSTRVDVWAGTRIARNTHGTLRVQADWWGDIHGEDPDLVPLRNPLEDSLRHGGSRVSLFAGVSKDLDRRGRHNLALEIGLPVDEWLDGPALSQEWSAVIGWRMKF